MQFSSFLFGLRSFCRAPLPPGRAAARCTAVCPVPRGLPCAWPCSFALGSCTRALERAPDPHDSLASLLCLSSDSSSTCRSSALQLQLSRSAGAIPLCYSISTLNLCRATGHAGQFSIWRYIQYHPSQTAGVRTVSLRRARSLVMITHVMREGVMGSSEPICVTFKFTPKYPNGVLLLVTNTCDPWRGGGGSVTGSVLIMHVTKLRPGPLSSDYECRRRCKLCLNETSQAEAGRGQLEN